MNSSNTLNLSQEPLAGSLLSGEQKMRLTEILDQYLVGLESGRPLDPQGLMAAHPDLAEPLGEYLQRLDDLHQAAAGFALPPPASSAEIGLPDSSLRRLGDFVLGREIGRGGMGVVYEAHQISLDRPVALKVLPFAAVLDPKQIARFKSEAQAAAQILHPNIVPVFAIGVDRGVHYYAMQRIDGQPLDRAIAGLRARRNERSRAVRVHEDDIRVGGTAAACPPVIDWQEPDQDRSRSVGDSLCSSHDRSGREYFQTVARLGIQAAEALHAAHEHGVIHRDIKPSNLLLDGMGKLWVTDFGLARCHGDGLGSMTGDIVGTMRYMSPEQAAGQTALIDHRADVYSLCVTLYELCTLRPAVTGNDGLELLGKVAAEEPAAPRQLNPHVPAPLETIILKGMAKRREDRYATADELAQDLRRFLDGRPIAARPPAIWERALRWGARHKPLVATVAVTALLAALGLGASALLIAREKSVAEQQSRLAEQHFREARAAVDRFGARFADRLAGVPGTRKVRQELLQETLEYYRRFADQAADHPDLLADVAATYSKIGALTDEMGSTEQAIAAHEQAVALSQQLVDSHPRDLEQRRRLASCQNNLALALRQAGRTDDALRAHQQAIDLQSDLVRRAPSDTYLGDLAASHTNLGLLLADLGDRAGAERSLQEAIRLHTRLMQTASRDARRRGNLAVAYNNLSSLHVGSHPEQAEACYAAALEHLRAALDSQPQSAEYQTLLAATYNNLGALQSRQERFQEAVGTYREAIRWRRALLDADPSHPGHRRDLAVGCNNLGLVLCRTQQLEPAEQAFRQALAIQHSLAELNPTDVELRSTLGGVYNNLGFVLEAEQRLDDAADAYEEAVEQQQLALSGAPAVLRYRLFLSKHFYNLGRVLREIGRPEDAIQIALRRRELWPHEASRLISVAEELALAGGQSEDANPALDLAIETLQRAATVGGPLPANTADRVAFAAIRTDGRFSKLLAGGNQ